MGKTHDHGKDNFGQRFNSGPIESQNVAESRGGKAGKFSTIFNPLVKAVNNHDKALQEANQKAQSSLDKAKERLHEDVEPKEETYSKEVSVKGKLKQLDKKAKQNASKTLDRLAKTVNRVAEHGQSKQVVVDMKQTAKALQKGVSDTLQARADGKLDSVTSTKSHLAALKSKAKVFKQSIIDKVREGNAKHDKAIEGFKDGVETTGKKASEAITSVAAATVRSIDSATTKSSKAISDNLTTAGLASNSKQAIKTIAKKTKELELSALPKIKEVVDNPIATVKSAKAKISTLDTKLKKAKQDLKAKAVTKLEKRANKKPEDFEPQLSKKTQEILANSRISSDKSPVTITTAKDAIKLSTKDTPAQVKELKKTLLKDAKTKGFGTAVKTDVLKAAAKVEKAVLTKAAKIIKD